MKNYRWFIMSLAFIATIINYLDRTALSYAITPLQKTFNLNNADFGLIASGFGIGYMIMTFIGGILVDRYGAHKIWSIAAIAWSVCCAFLGAVSGFWMLLILRILLGVSEGPAFPSLTRVATDWLTTAQRARALAFGLVAVPLASVIGAPLISALIIFTGWCLMFVILGCLGIIWAFIWHKFFTDKPQQNSHISKHELAIIESHEIVSIKNNQSSSPTTWKFLLFNPALLANNFAFFAFGYLLFFSLTWLPGYFEQVYHVKLKEIALFLIAPWLLGAIMLACGGILSDWLWQKKHSMRIARSHIIWSCQLLSAACFIPVILYHSLILAIVFISLGIGFGLMPNAVFYALNADLARDRAATSLGIMDCGFAAAGILSPLLTGVIAHITGNFNAALLLLILFSVTAALGIIVFQHPDKYLKTL